MTRQTDNEREALREGVSRRAKSVARKVTRSQETGTSTGTIALAQAIIPLAMGIVDWLDGSGAGIGKKVKPFFRLMSPELTSSIIARAVLDGISKQRKRTALAGAVGRAIQTEYQLQTFKERHRQIFLTKVIENKHETYGTKERNILAEARRMGITNKWWDRADQISVGMTALMLMEKHTGMIVLDHRVINKRRVGIVEPTPDMQEWLEESYRRENLLGAMYEPMIEKPEPWVSNYRGGYKLDEFQDKGFINSKEGNHYDDLTYLDCPEVFNAVNTLQNTAWMINNEVLDVMRTLWEEDSTIAGLPHSSMTEEPKYSPDFSDEQKKIHFREVRKVRGINSMHVGRRFRLYSTLKTAKKFSAEPEIYFPHHLDFRGRAYPIPKVLNPQGDDMAKGVLQFAEGKVIGPEGYKWFLIHGANLCGFKGSFHDRITSILAAEEGVLESAANPLDCDFWAQADKPFQFLAWCLEFAAYQKDPVYFKSHLACAMDGSNNGLQIMSLLLRDKEMGAATNCSPCDTPADIYQSVADKVKAKLRSEPSDDHLMLLKYGIDRSLMKKVVMTVPYGASYFSLVQIFQDTIYGRFLGGGGMPFDRQLRHACTILSFSAWDVIKETLPNALYLMRWIKDTIRPAMVADNVVSWTTPMGLKVYQGYKQTVRRRVVTAIGAKIKKQAWYQDPVDSLSKRNNYKAIVPNYIHSLDGCVMMSTVNQCNEWGVDSLAMVHDSFATHACDAPLLAEALREQAVKIFSDNLLESFDKDISRSYPDTHDQRLDPPSLGDLDIHQLKKSLYFFH